MVRKDGAEAKRDRMERMARKIMAALNRGETPLLSKTVAEFEYEFGLTKERIEEYLQTLATLDRFLIDKEQDRIKPTTQS